jgi:hypothetical protein
MQLSVEPRKWYTWDFDLRDSEGHGLGEIALSSWRERGTLTVDGSRYAVRRDGWTGPLVLADEGSVRGRARKTGFWGGALEIELDADHYTLKPRSAWRRELVLAQGGEELGTVNPVSWHCRRARVELSDRLSPLHRAFVVWLAMLLWKREADASAGA